MSFTFGNRPEDVVTDSKGNTLSGVTLVLYETESDATAQTEPVGTVSTDGGVWSFESPDSPVLWVRTPAGSVYSVSSTDVTMATFIDEIQTTGTPAHEALVTEVGSVFGDTVSSLRGGNSFVALGDSLSTSMFASSGGGGYGQAWAQMVCAISEQRINTIGQGGVAGETAAQVLARVPDVLALGPRIVTVLVGHNDLHGGTSTASFKASVEAIVTQLRAGGVRVFLCTILPRTNTTYLSTTLEWNSWIKWYAQQGGLDLLDFFAVVADPATGTSKAEYQITGDVVHPNGLAHVAMAEYATTRIQTPSYEPVRALVNTDPQNMQNNACLAVGAPDYFIPQGDAVTGVTEGLFVDSDFRGKSWRWVATAAGAGNRMLTTYQITTGYSVGDVLLFSARVKVTGSTVTEPALLQGLNVQALWTGATPAYTTQIEGLSVDAAGLVQWREAVPAGTSAIQLNTYLGGIAGESGTWQVGEFGIFNLTAMGLA